MQNLHNAILWVSHEATKVLLDITTSFGCLMRAAKVPLDVLQNKETDEAKKFLNYNMAAAEYCCCVLHSNYGFFVTQYAELVAGGKTQTKCGPAGLQRNKETWSVAEKTFRWSLCNARARMKPSHRAENPEVKCSRRFQKGSNGT
jgi:hypothetical protein